MPRGTKGCINCGALTGPRAFECPKCHTPFPIKSKPQATKVVESKSVSPVKATGQFKVNQTVKVIAEWLPKECKGKRARIVRFQQNTEPFAVVYWKHTQECGDKFALHELESVE